VRQVLLWAGLSYVGDGEKDGGGVGVVVDFGAGEKLGGRRGMWRGSRGSSAWAEAVVKEGAA